MNYQPFTIQEPLRFGFRAFKNNLGLLICVSLIGLSLELTSQILINIITHRSCFTQLSVTSASVASQLKYLVNWASEESTPPAIDSSADEPSHQPLAVMQLSILQILLILMVKLLAFLGGLLILMGWNRVGLDIYDTGTSSLNRLLSPSGKVLPFLLTSIAYRLIVATGTFLFVVPGIIWALTYCLADLIVIDSDVRMREALRISARLTYGYKWDLLFFFFVALIITFISVITLIGPFILVYVLFLSRVYIYRTLQERWQLEHQPPTPFMP